MPTNDAICYVMPSHAEHASTHLAHVPHLLEEVARCSRLFVIVERGSAPVIAGAQEVLVQRRADHGRWARTLELLRLVRHVRDRGCRRFFVRISRGAGLTLAMLSRPLGIEVFYWHAGTAREAWPAWGEHGAERVRLHLDDLLTRLLLRSVDRLVTGPESMVDYYVRTYGVRRSRCVVVPNDVDVGRFDRADAGARAQLRSRWGFADGDAAVLFVGRLSRYKGGAMLPLLLDMLERLPTATRTGLVVAGQTHLDDVAERLGAYPMARLLGAVPNEELPDVYRAADVFVLPSLSEGFPRVVLEAMAAGLPIAAFDVGGVRGILGPEQQEFVVGPRDVRALAARVRMLADDPDLRARLGDENRERVRRFDTPVVAELFCRRVVAPSI